PTVTIMTTMFIQLRRVVYLLVLLQCCVCVVLAQSGFTSVETELGASFESMKKKIVEVENAYEAAKETVGPLMNAIVVCEEASLALSNANEKANVFVEKTKEEIKQKVANMFDIGTREVEAKELVNTITVAVENATKATAAVNSAADTSFSAANKLEEIASPLYNISTNFSNFTTSVRELSGTTEEEKRMAENGSFNITKAKEFVITLLSRVNDATQQASLAEQDVQNATQIRKLVEETIHSLRSAVKKTSEEHTRRNNAGVDKEVSEQEKTEGGNTNQNNQTSQNDRTSPEKVEVPNPQDVNQRETETHDEKSQQGVKNENTTENSNENKETLNPPSDSADLPSRTVSSVSNGVNVSDVNDSSSSPALVHGPLLLLLLCVLDCALVC
ncbi:uncharacterized protein TM35_000061010, partial [Trypanosoma theileri]